MKKNISINISGTLFHMEEDAYERLKNYLDGISQYFSTYDDSKEIIADIENRIAEIFSTKVKPGKEVLTIEDVESLIAIMGTVNDFKAMEEEIKTSNPTNDPNPAEDPYLTAAAPDEAPKKVYRDTRRKVLGGIAAGLANYLSIDPIWVRLVLLVLFFSATPFHGLHRSQALGHVVVLLYIICWIFIPGNNHLGKNEKFKKLFRSRDKRIFGGIASGLSVYFKTDPLAIRLLFVGLVFLGGSGILIYIILWVITPEAKTFTDKMQMEGNPITLSNIENSIKNALHIKETEENTLTKILLFPFRIIAMVFNGLAKVLGPLVIVLGNLIRVATGVVIVIVSLILMFAFTMLVLAVFKLVSVNAVHYGNFPWELVRQNLPEYLALSAYFVLFIPLLLLCIGGLSFIANKRLLHATIGWSFFGIWVLALIFTSFQASRILFKYRSQGNYTVQKTMPQVGKTLSLQLNEIETGIEGYPAVALHLEGYEGTALRLESKYMARGSSRKNASDNARQIQYLVAQKDSLLIFNSNIHFPSNSEFRFQHLRMKLYIPYGTKFTMTPDLYRIARESLHRNGYSSHDLTGTTWVFMAGEGLKCLDCLEYNGNDEDDEDAVLPFIGRRHNRAEEVDFWGNTSSGDDDQVKKYSITDFTCVKARDAIEVNIVHGNSFKVVSTGNVHALKKLTIRKNGDCLEMGQEREEDPWWGFDHDDAQVKVIITMPELEHLELSGASKGMVQGFKSNTMEAHLSGASDARFEVDVRELKIGGSGASHIAVDGNGDLLTIDISGASEFNGYDYQTNRVEAVVSGASHAEVVVRELLQVDASGAGKLSYKGHPRVTSKLSGAGNVEQE